MVKLDKMTGKTVWTAKELSDSAAYSSITVALTCKACVPT